MLNLTKKQEKIFKYLRSDIRNISKESFIKFLFPDSQVYFDYVPTFCDESVPVFLVDTHKEKSKKVLMNMSSNLVVLFPSTKNTIDGKKGFLSILMDVLGFKVSDSLVKELNAFEDADYWFVLKTWYTLDEVLEPDTPQQASSSTFNLFKSLFFYDFGTLYKLYKESEEPHQKVFSSLLTMMGKAKSPESQTNISPFYRSILQSHCQHVPAFKKAVYNYSQTPVTELDFVKFLYQCSSTYLNRQ